MASTYSNSSSSKNVRKRSTTLSTLRSPIDTEERQTDQWSSNPKLFLKRLSFLTVGSMGQLTLEYRLNGDLNVCSSWIRLPFCLTRPLTGENLSSHAQEMANLIKERSIKMLKTPLKRS